MSEKDRTILALRSEITEKNGIIANLSAELKAERIKYDNLAKKADEQYQACMQERAGLLAKIEELKAR